jgi:hypothetical protein
MSKFIQKIIRDLAEGRNLENYTILAFIVVIIALDIFNLASPAILSEITLAVLGLVVLSNLNVQDTILNLRRELAGYTKVVQSFEEVVSEVSGLVFNPKNRLADVYIYKGNEVTLEQGDRYFQDTIKAIENGYVGRYNRIDTVRSPQEIQNLIALMKVFYKSEKALRHVNFFVNYHPLASYISFLIVSDDDCFVGFPYLSDIPFEVKGYQCGVRIKDKKVFHSLKEVFQEIRQHEDFVDLIEMPTFNCSESEWEKLRLHMEKRLFLFVDSTNAPPNNPAGVNC